MKELLKHIPFATLIVSYLFICGGLYLVGFWSTFGIDALSLSNIWDIPKSFIYSFIKTMGLGIFLSIIIFNIVGIFKPSLRNVFKYAIGEEIERIRFLLDHFFFINSHIIGLLLHIFLGLFVCYEVCNINLFKSAFPHPTTRLFVGVFIIVLPLMNFGVGKKEALFIHQNSNIRYISNLRIRVSMLF